MTRPKKEPELVTTHRVTIRFTERQYEVIVEDAKRARLPIADYLRKLIANHGLTITYKIAQDNQQLHDLTLALGKIGNNLNQISRFFHQGGSKTTEIEKDIRSCIMTLYEMSEKLDKIEGVANDNP